MHDRLVSSRTYAKEALVSLGVFTNVEPKLAQVDNVRMRLNLVSRGEAKFGIVYATDANRRSQGESGWDVSGFEP